MDMEEIVSSLENISLELQNLAQNTDDKNAQKMYSNYAGQLKNISQGLQNRVSYIEGQEPQFLR